MWASSRQGHFPTGQAKPGWPCHSRKLAIFCNRSQRKPCIHVAMIHSLLLLPCVQHRFINRMSASAYNNILLACKSKHGASTIHACMLLNHNPNRCDAGQVHVLLSLSVKQLQFWALACMASDDSRQPVVTTLSMCSIMPCADFKAYTATQMYQCVTTPKWCWGTNISCEQVLQQHCVYTTPKTPT